MLHSTKDAAHHAEFGKFMGAAFEKHCSKDVRIPTFLSDAESALKEFVKVAI
jgi:hypothetical protein